MSQLNALERLCHAVVSRDLPELQQALAAGADPNNYSPAILDQRPMHEAAARNFVAGLRVLHEAGGEIDGPLSLLKTPLLVAVGRRHIEAAQWLLQNGADVTRKARGAERNTPLEVALEAQDLSMASMLLQERPQLRDMLLEGIACKLISASHPSTMAQWLIDAGVSPDLVTWNGDPWLARSQEFMAHLNGPLTKLLIEAGANVNALGDRERTALHEAVRYRNAGPFMQLLRAGANPDLPNDQGMTVRDLLKDEKNQELQDLFVAWESSEAAHRVIHRAAAPQDLKPL